MVVFCIETTKLVSMQSGEDFNIVDSARKHGIGDEDIRHALRNRVRTYLLDDFVMIIGPTINGKIVEVGINPGRRCIVHAMEARRKFWP